MVMPLAKMEVIKREEDVWGNQEFYYEHVKFEMFIRQVSSDDRD